MGGSRNVARVLIGDDDQASATTASFSDDGKLQRQRRANVTMVKAKVLAATANDSVRSSQMGIGKQSSRRRDRREWDRRDGEIVVNQFGAGMVWMLQMALGCCE